MSSDMEMLINSAKQQVITSHLAPLIFSLIDLTSLNETDNNDIISQLCHLTKSRLGQVAAVCVYPQFISTTKELLKNSSVKIATVVNFPHANDSLDNVCLAIKKAIADGADEIDLVFPFHDFLQGKYDYAYDFIKQSKLICGNSITLKVILETGALITTKNISDACEIAIKAGADFLKTSTGKIATGATLEAAYLMLSSIKTALLQGKKIGFKAAGGIRTIKDAASYIYLAEQILGFNWISPQTFRFGASSLAENLLTEEHSSNLSSHY